MTLGFDVRGGEGRLVAGAAIAIAVAGCGEALVASAADALFLSRVGVRHLGTLFAISAAILIATLGVVGGLADRVDRGRLLVVLGAAAAVAVAGLAAALPIAPTATAIAAPIVGKQFAAAFDLAFWVLLAERLDARQNRRLLPLLVAAEGLGTAIGAFAVDPIAAGVGMNGVLGVGAAAFAAAAVCAARVAILASGRPIAVHTTAPSARRAERLLGAGYRRVRRSSLATHLAVLVAVGGVFGPIMYYLLGVSAAAAFPDEIGLAGFLGQYRGAVQLAILAAQWLVAPRLLARAGVARALILAPMGAVLAAAAVATSGALIAVVIAQGATRLLDVSVDSPAEKLAQNLLPQRVRGRVAGFLEGVAKRVGAITGGLSASALVVWPSALAAVTFAVAAVWLVASVRLMRRFPALAVAELAGPEGARQIQHAAMTLTDDRTVDAVRRALRRGPRRALAIELVTELGARGRLDAVAELCCAAAEVEPGADSADQRDAKDESHRGGSRACTHLLTTALAVAERHPTEGDRVADSIAALSGVCRAAVRASVRQADTASVGVRETDGWAEVLVRAVSLLGHLGRVASTDAHRRAIDGVLVRLADEACPAAVQYAAALARVRIALRATADGGAADDPSDADHGDTIDGGGSGHLDTLVDDGLTDDDPATRRAALAALRSEVALATVGAVPDADRSRAMALARTLLRAARRWSDPAGAPDRALALASLGRAVDALAPAARAATDAEAVLLRTEVRALGERLAAFDPASAPWRVEAEAPVRAAAVRLVAAAANPDDASLLCAALGDPDEAVRRAAEDGLRRLGDAALEPLLVAARYGRRRTRHAALERLAELRVSPTALDGLIDAELAIVERTLVHRTALAHLNSDSEGDAGRAPIRGAGRESGAGTKRDRGGLAISLLGRRLDERVVEVGHTVLRLIEARGGAAAAAARRFLDASDLAGRARALEALDTALTRTLAGRVLAALEPGPALPRARTAAARLGLPAGAVADTNAAVRAELGGSDRLARALVVHAVGQRGRAAHRDAIAAAAAAAARVADPLSLLRRLGVAPDTDARDTSDDVPRSVETMMTLSRIPLFAELGPRQLDALAAVVRWTGAEPGDVLVREGEAGDAMYFVVSGAVRVEIAVEPAAAMAKAADAPPVGQTIDASPGESGVEAEGEALISAASGPEAAAPTVRVLGELGPGEPFGEMSLFDDAPRSATVVAVARTRLGRIDRDAFVALLDDVPGIAIAICRVLSRRIRNYNRRG